ncbi:unnamed protein product [Mesocestoides corti]|uniref:Uncharacterized protein n=1 Tax=Mesocestoides corti TaxID=53468 RepID=A0A0R3UE61_MESCO|nr:unnamed protein product [Mesocestoides corti]
MWHRVSSLEFANVFCYPFESYSGLIHACGSLNPLTDEPQTARSPLHSDNASSNDFVNMLLGTTEEGVSQLDDVADSRGLLHETDCYKRADDMIPLLSPRGESQRSCSIMPRYIADSIKHASSLSCGFPGSPNADSGISSTSRTSHLTYLETLALRAQRRAMSTTSEPASRPLHRASLLERVSQEYHS